MSMGGKKHYNGFKFRDPSYATYNLNGQVNRILQLKIEKGSGFSEINFTEVKYE